MQRVTIVQRRLTHYRVELFQEMKSRLAGHNIRLRLLYGTAGSEEESKKDLGYLPWAEQLETRYFLGNRICWQPFAHEVADEDLVIITQENSLLANHLALLRRPSKRVAFWGHGGNFQGKSAAFREQFKRWTTRKADWYFAYTDLSVQLVAQAGFPLDRTTQLNNSCDLSGLRKDLEKVSEFSPSEARKHFGLGAGPVGLMLGSIYAQKRPDFLVRAAALIRHRMPDFQLLVIGGGPAQSRIEEACLTYEWIRYVGPQHGVEKARALYVADVLLNPGLVGLGILDSFVAGTPILTTDCGIHSPEIAYLDGKNGVMTPDDAEAYADACVSLLKERSRLAWLQAGCRRAAGRYTLEKMVQRFTTGIISALQTEAQ